MKKQQILDVLNSNNGIITNKEAVELGILRTTLYRLKEKGLMHSISRDVYSLNAKSLKR